MKSAEEQLRSYTINNIGNVYAFVTIYLLGRCPDRSSLKAIMSFLDKDPNLKLGSRKELRRLLKVALKAKYFQKKQAFSLIRLQQKLQI